MKGYGKKRPQPRTGRSLTQRRRDRGLPAPVAPASRVWIRIALVCVLLGLCAAGQVLAAKGEEHLQPLRREAVKGLPSAQHTLGRCYVLGISVKRDVSKGLDLLRKAAAQDYPPALLFLARIHERGTGVPRDFVKARHWYEKAADLDIEAADLKLAPFHSVDPDREFTLFHLPLGRTTPFALRYAVQKRGAEPIKLLDGSSCDIFPGSALLPGSDRLRACYTDSRRLAHLEYRFPPKDGAANPSLNLVLEHLTDKYGQPKVTDSEGVPLEYSWRSGGVSIALWMDHPSRTAFLRYTVRKRQERYLREQKRREEAGKPPGPEL